LKTDREKTDKQTTQIIFLVLICVLHANNNRSTTKVLHYSSDFPKTESATTNSNSSYNIHQEVVIVGAMGPLRRS